MATDVERLIQQIEADFRGPLDEVVNKFVEWVSRHSQELSDKVIREAQRLKESKDRLDLSSGEVKVLQDKIQNFNTEARRQKSMAGIVPQAEPSKPD